jgi:opacity protein-like surface antigen
LNEKANNQIQDGDLKSILAFFMVLLVAANLSGANLKGLSYAGIRIGVGHTAQANPDVKYSNYTITSDQNGFYTEAFFNWHFLNEFALDVGLASLSRGEFRWRIPDIGNFFGSINLYPIMVGLKIKPLASIFSDDYQPWMAGGGSVVVGRAVVEGGTVLDPYAYVASAESQTALGWWLGAGFDSFVSSTIALSSSFRYQHMKFGDPVGGYLDHSGYQISFGIGYIFKKIN